MTLELVPSGDLVFKGPFNVVSTTALKLVNTGNERFAYKIKTTAPKRYCVKPNSGFLESNNSVNIQVMLQPQTGGSQDDRSKHKFMVQWAAVPNTYLEDVETFWKQDLTKYTVHDSKLKCVFVDEQSAAVVPNDTYGYRDTDASSTRTTELINPVGIRSQQSNSRNDTSTTATSSLNQRFTSVSSRDSNVISNQYQDRQQNSVDGADIGTLKKEIDELQDKYKRLQDKVKQEELRQRISGNDRIDNPVINRSKPTQYQLQKGLVLFGIPFNEQLVLVAFVISLLFGFSFGYFLFSCGN